MDETVKAMVLAFFNACAVFIRGSWTAVGGRTITRTLKNGETKTDKAFEIMIPSGQINGTPEVGSVVLVAKAKGEVALFVLTEQMGSGTDNKGVSYTLWNGTMIERR